MESLNNESKDDKIIELLTELQITQTESLEVQKELIEKINKMNENQLQRTVDISKYLYDIRALDTKIKGYTKSSGIVCGVIIFAWVLIALYYILSTFFAINIINQFS